MARTPGGDESHQPDSEERAAGFIPAGMNSAARKERGPRRSAAMDGEEAHHENLSPSRRKAVFLDRDGVINRNVVRGNITHPPDCVEDFELLPGVIEAAQRL